MSVDILVIVAIVSFIQTIFGIGVLLFGTPLLMLMGYNFFQTIIILLPISLLINLFQIFNDYRALDKVIYKNILIYSIPCIVIFLIFIKEIEINIGILVGLFLLFVSAKDFSSKTNKIINFLVHYEKSYLILLGIVHGLTNLGGSLLSAFVHAQGSEKKTIRSTIAASYATFAIFQIATLFIFGFDENIKFSILASSLFVSLTIFFATEKIIYLEINANAYRKLFSGFLFLSGILLCLKSL